MGGFEGDLEGKVALVTGGSRGIGRAICLGLAGSGAYVVINYQSAHEAAQLLADEIKAAGGRCELRRFDVAQYDQVQQACQSILDAQGRLDILVNNAGITRDQLLVRMKPQEWKDVLEVNLTGAFHCARAVAKAMMKRRQGCIINIASVAGMTGNPGQANYSASKAGLIGLTKALAKELAPWNIRVNAVSPGYITTEMTEGLPEKVKEEILGLVPLKRFGSTQDVAFAVLFLASRWSEYITGEVLNVSGGLLI